MERENEMIGISHRFFCVHWRMSLNASDYAGQHKGYHGNISVTYKVLMDFLKRLVGDHISGQPFCSLRASGMN